MILQKYNWKINHQRTLYSSLASFHSSFVILPSQLLPVQRGYFSYHSHLAILKLLLPLPDPAYISLWLLNLLIPLLYLSLQNEFFSSLHLNSLIQAINHLVTHLRNNRTIYVGPLSTFFLSLYPYYQSM